MYKLTQLLRSMGAWLDGSPPATDWIVTHAETRTRHGCTIYATTNATHLHRVCQAREKAKT